MDGFMERIAQNFGTQDVIHANNAAEAQEFEEAKNKVGEYEKVLEDVRRLNLKTIETNEKTGQLVSASIERLEEFKSASGQGIASEDIEGLKTFIGERHDELKLSMQVPSGEETVFFDSSSAAVTAPAPAPVRSEDEVSKLDIADLKNYISARFDEVMAKEVKVEAPAPAPVYDQYAVPAEDKASTSEEIESLRAFIGAKFEELKLSAPETSGNAEEISELKAMIATRLDDLKVASMNSAPASVDAGAIREVVKEQDEYIHKENVRVYRNVQASIVDELKLQTEALSVQNKLLEQKVKGLKGIVVTSLIVGIVTLIGVAGVVVTTLFGISLF